MILLLLAVGCAKTSDEPGDTQDTQDTQDTGDSGAELGPEICDDGVDNDGDGLMDCEDADCVDACTETLCDDGVDNDGDGLTDCDDEDCCFVQAQVTSGAWAWEADYGADHWPWTVHDFVARDIAGTLTGAGASTSFSCTWTVGVMTQHTYSGSQFSGYRSDFSISSACPVQTSGFLPDLSAEALTHDGGLGGWYQATSVWSSSVPPAGTSDLGGAVGGGVLTPGAIRSLDAAALGL